MGANSHAHQPALWLPSRPLLQGGTNTLGTVYVRGLEAGRFNPTLNVLFDIGRALDVHPARLLADIPLDVETHGDARKRPGPPEGSVRGPKGSGS